MKKKLKGFTLVEIVAVLAVTMALVAIVLAHYGRVAESARNAVIHNFLKDCQAVYLRLQYGESPDYTTLTNSVCFKDYVNGSTLAEVKLQTDGDVLNVSEIPPSLFKDGRASVAIDYRRRIFDGESEQSFLRQVLW